MSCNYITNISSSTVGGLIFITFVAHEVQYLFMFIKHLDILFGEEFKLFCTDFCLVV